MYFRSRRSVTQRQFSRPVPPPPERAVFLSYASQDAEAAKKICDALRAVRVEVWFDQNELVGGDAWDQKIRRQIKDCALFVPIISANTQARTEGYFRLEWRIADQRTHLMAKGRPFLLPVVIDDTRDAEAHVPDSFTDVQWTRLSGGETPAKFCERVLTLLRGEGTSPRSRPASHDEGVASPESQRVGRRGPAAAWAVGMVAALLVLALVWQRRTEHSPNAGAGTRPPTAEKAAAPLSAARQPVAQARALFDALDSTRDDFRLAEDLLAQAKTMDANDAEVWAAAAQLDERYMTRGWDQSDTRREAARAAVQRALRLDPKSFEVRFAQTGLFGNTGRDGEEKERLLRVLRSERPRDQRVLRSLAATINRLGRVDESNAILDESAALPGGDPLALYNKSQALWFVGRTTEAEAAMHAAIAQAPFAGALLMDVWYAAKLHGDLEGARATLNRIPSLDLLADRGCFFAFYVEYIGRHYDAARARLRDLPRDWLNDSWHRGPKAMLVGDTLCAEGRNEAAAVEWRAALKLVEERLAASPNDSSLLEKRLLLLARLGAREEAERQFALLLQMAGVEPMRDKPVPGWATDACVRLSRKADAIRQISLGLKRERHAVDFTAADLRLNPDWDPLRGEPEFGRVIAQAEEIERAAAAEQKAVASAAASATMDDKSVAVLAFADLSAAHDSEYFSDGISEELLNVLAKVPGLKVSARTSAFYFKGKQVQLPEIAKQLGVAYVVEGSVRKSGSKVRITAQLIKAEDGFHVWSDNFDRELKDIFAMQDEIAGLIAKNLQLKMGVASGPSPTANAEAFQLYLQGRQAWNLRTLEGYDRAEALFTRAIELDPKFARAYVGRSDARQFRAATTRQFGSWDQRDSAVAISFVSEIEHVLELEPDSAEAHASLGSIYQRRWNKEAADREFRRAIALNPNYAIAHQWLGVFLWSNGRIEEARAELLRASELDPLAVNIATATAGVLSDYGSPTEALASAERAMMLQPDSSRAIAARAQALVELGRTTEAVALARKLLGKDTTTQGLGRAIFVLARAGAKSEIRQSLRGTTAADDPMKLVERAALGNWDEFFAAWSTKSIPSDNPWILYEPTLDPVRSDPRFLLPLKQIGLAEAHARAQAWRAAHPPEKPATKN